MTGFRNAHARNGLLRFELSPCVHDPVGVGTSNRACLVLNGGGKLDLLKKFENHPHMVAVYAVWYNFIRIHVNGEGNEKVEGQNRVSEKQAFGVLVRAIGVLVFLEGLRTSWFAFSEWGMRGTSVGVIVGSSLVYGIFAIVLGATMIRWPDWVVHLAWLERLPTIGRMPDDDNQSKSN